MKGPIRVRARISMHRDSAVTRRGKLVVLVGTKKALNMAVRRQDTAKRCRAIPKRLQEA